MNKVAMNIHARVLGRHMHSLPLSIIQEMELVGHIGICLASLNSVSFPK